MVHHGKAYCTLNQYNFEWAVRQQTKSTTTQNSPSGGMNKELLGDRTYIDADADNKSYVAANLITGSHQKIVTRRGEIKCNKIDMHLKKNNPNPNLFFFTSELVRLITNLKHV